MTNPAYLQSFVKECSEASVETTGEKFTGWESLVGILVYKAMRLLLPELKEWLKLGAAAVALKRQELRDRLIQYAKEKELDFPQAEKAAGQIANRIDEMNLPKIVAELEGK
jgi:hypothetical protein